MIDADKAWISDLHHVMDKGAMVSPRGMKVAEVIGFQSVVSMANPIIICPERKLGYKFMAAEAAWILSGDNRVETIRSYSKDIANFSDDDISFFGAYGPKVNDQIPYVVACLHKDPDSRQAVINIWRESPGPSKDIPCTLSLQFLVRNHVLHCVASMRSSDLWLGHPYDIFNFSAIAFYVMLELNKIRLKNDELTLVLGGLILTAGSKHIYERNFDAVTDIVKKFQEGGYKENEKRAVFAHPRYDTPDNFIEDLWECANSQVGALRLLR